MTKFRVEVVCKGQQLKWGNTATPHYCHHVLPLWQNLNLFNVNFIGEIFCPFKKSTAQSRRLSSHNLYLKRIFHHASFFMERLNYIQQKIRFEFGVWLEFLEFRPLFDLNVLMPLTQNLPSFWIIHLTSRFGSQKQRKINWVMIFN
jgi:hypothetical protein